MRLTVSLLLAALTLGAAPMYAQSANNGKTPVSCENVQLPSISTSLRNVKFLKGKPSTKAKYYIYLYAASWCGHCVNAMPTIVNAYPKMKADKVEIILLGGDRSDAEVLHFVKQFKIKFAAVQCESNEAQKLYNYLPPMTFPWVRIMANDGETIFSGHPNIVFPDQQWRYHIQEYEADLQNRKAKAKKAQEEAEEE